VATVLIGSTALIGATVVALPVVVVSVGAVPVAPVAPIAPIVSTRPVGIGCAG
jgi:hypothetical protein